MRPSVAALLLLIGVCACLASAEEWTYYECLSNQQSMTASVRYGHVLGGGEGYDPNMNCKVLIQPEIFNPLQDRLVFMFRFFELQPTVNGTCVDVVRIYDGDNTTAPLLAEYCGTLPENDPLPWYTASGGVLLVVFNTDATISGNGFAASYSVERYLKVYPSPVLSIGLATITLEGLVLQNPTTVLNATVCGRRVTISGDSSSTSATFELPAMNQDANCTVDVYSTNGFHSRGYLQLLSCQTRWALSGAAPLCTDSYCVTWQRFSSIEEALNCPTNTSYYGTAGYWAPMSNQTEREALLSMIAASMAVNSFAVAVSDAAVEGEWRVLTGTQAGTLITSPTVPPPSWWVWGAGEPNNFGGENWAQISVKRTINDIGAYVTLTYPMRYDHVRTSADCTGICDVVPTSSPAGGGILVTIIGVDLGNGNDIDMVTLCGVTAHIRTQDKHWVVVHAGYQSDPMGLPASAGPVQVRSASAGTKTLAGVFRYTAVTTQAVAANVQCLGSRCYELVTMSSDENWPLTAVLNCYGPQERFALAATRFYAGRPGFLATIPSESLNTWLFNTLVSGRGQDAATGGLLAADFNTFRWWTGPDAPIAIGTVSPATCLQEATCPWHQNEPSGGETTLYLTSSQLWNDGGDCIGAGGIMLVEYVNATVGFRGGCPAGWYQAGASGCVLCPAGTFSNSTTAAACTTCPTGTYSWSGMTTCFDCPSSGYLCSNPAVTPTPCPPGTRSSNYACVACPSGTFQPSSGQSSCITCPAGYQCLNATRPQPCPHGQYAGAGQTACSPCPLDTYANGTALGACPGCPFGTRTNSTGALSCTAISLLTVQPSSGHADGGYTVTLTGYAPLANASDFVSATLNGVPASFVQYDARYVVYLTAGYVETPDGRSGTVELRGREFGALSLPGAFSYLPRPLVTSVSPTLGRLAGGTIVTLIGSRLVSPVSVSLAGVAATVLDHPSSTQIVVLSGPTPSTRSASAVFNSSLHGSAIGPTFSYVTPTPTSLTPTQGPTRGGFLITVLGSYLAIDAADLISVTVAGANATAVTVVSSTRLDVLAPAAVAGLAVAGPVVVHSAVYGNGSGPNFNYRWPPFVASVTPSQGSTAGGYVVTLSGTNLGLNDVLAVRLAEVLVSALTWVSTTRIVVLAAATGTDPTGPVFVSSTVFGSSNSSSFTYLSGPKVTSVVPSSGPLAGNQRITLFGSQLFPSIVSIRLHDVPVTISAATVTWVSNTEIRVVSGARSEAGSGPITIATVTSGTGVSAQYTYNPRPVLSAALPTQGPVAGGSVITLSGSNLGLNDVTAVEFGSGVASALTWASSTRVVVITPAQSGAGAVSLRLTSTLYGSSVATAGLYTYMPPPSITGVSPTQGPRAGGRVVTLAGTHLAASGADLTGVTLAGVAAAATTWVSSTRVLVVAGAASSAGSGAVVLTSAVHGSGSFSSFTYLAPPSVTAVTPTHGPLSGGSAVTLTGERLGANDISAVLFGSTAAPAVQWLSATALVATTPPASTAGSVTVTVVSDLFGSGPSTVPYRYNAAPVLTQVVPSVGPASGGQLITLTGSNLGANDITAVRVCNVSASAVTWLSATQVTAVTAAAVDPNGCTGPVLLHSTAYGAALLAGAYVYRPRAIIGSVVPFFVPDSTGGTVTLTGSNLGSGTDVFQVLLCGQPVSSIVSQTSTRVVVQAAPLSGAMTRFEAETRSAAYGVGVSSAGSFYYSITGGSGGAGQPAAVSISPTDGPLAGGTTVTIFGSNLGSEVQFVGLAGVQATIVSRLGTAVVVTAGAATAATSGAALVIAPGAGVSQTGAGQQFTYNAAPVLLEVRPAAGAFQGGTVVTLKGTALVPATADPTLSVTLCGRAAAAVQSQAPTVIVFVTPAAVEPGLCALAIQSSRAGAGSLADAYRYNVPPAVTDSSESSGPQQGGLLVTLSGPVLGSGSDIYSVTVGGAAATLVTQSATSVTLRTPALATTGTQAVLVRSADFGDAALSGGFVYNPAGTITSVIPTHGPFVGTNLVTISGSNLGSGSDITAVKLAGVSAIVVSQSSTRVVVRAGAADVAGTGAVTVDSTHYGSTALAAAYRYNRPGLVSAIVPSTGRCYGGEFVTILGSDLCDPGAGDVLSVTLRDVPAAAIVSQSASRLVVSTGSTTLVLGPGAVLVQSVHYGNTSTAGNSSLWFAYRPSFVLSSTNGSLLEEAEAETALTVRLDAPPAVEVTTALDTNRARAVVRPDSLSFNASTWDQPQTVYLRAQPDWIDNGDAACPLRLNSSTSYDESFVGLTAVTDHRCIDNDVAGLWFGNVTPTTAYLTRTGGFALIETLTALALGVRLTSEPLQPVTVQASAEAARVQITLPAPLSFNASNWNVTQPLTLSLADDGQTRSMEWSAAGVRAASTDPLYDTARTPSTASAARLLLVDVSVTGAVQVSQASRNTSEAGTDATVYVMLNEPRTQDLPLRLYSSRPDEGRPAVSALTLSPGDLYQLLAVAVLPEWDRVDDDDQPYAVLVEYGTETAGVPLTVTLPVWLYNENVDRAGLVRSASNLTVNETGSTATLDVALQSKPTAAVTVSVTCNSTVARCVPPSLSFSPSNWNVTQSITVSGVRNAVRGDLYTNLTLSSVTADAKYHQMVHRVPVTNLDVYWPGGLVVEPELMPMAGLNGSLSGTGVLMGAEVLINSVPALNVTQVAADSDAAVHSARALLSVEPVVAAYTLFFPPPRFNYTGYANLTVLNPDGGSATAIDVMFFSEDCPQVGLIGHGTECRQCPFGAYCPGGNRIWPLYGWWSPGEFSGQVGPCEPDARCLGGRTSPCREGHTGSFCSLCEPGWYMDTDDLCARCESDGYLAMLFVAQFAFLALFLLMLIFARDTTVDKVEFVLMNLRVMWVVGASSSDNLPSEVQSLFAVLRLFVNDVGFSNPACSGLNNYAAVYGLNVGVAFTCVAVLVLVVLGRYGYEAATAKRYLRHTGGSRSDSLQVSGIARRRMAEQSFRMLFFICAFCFEVLMVKSLGGVYCTEVNSEYRLVQELDQVCFQGRHVPVLLVSIGLLLFLGLAWPLMGYYGGYRMIRRGETVNVVARMAAYKLTDEYREDVWWWGASGLLFFEMPLIINSEIVSSERPDVGLLVQLVLVVIYMLLFLILRPFRDRAKNVGLTVVMITNVVTSVAQVLAAFEFTAVSNALSFLVMALLLLFVAFSTALLLWTAGLERLITMLRVGVLLRKDQHVTDHEVLRVLRRLESTKEARERFEQLQDMERDRSGSPVPSSHASAAPPSAASAGQPPPSAMLALPPPDALAVPLPPLSAHSAAPPSRDDERSDRHRRNDDDTSSGSEGRASAADVRPRLAVPLVVVPGAVVGRAGALAAVPGAAAARARTPGPALGGARPFTPVSPWVRATTPAPALTRPRAASPLPSGGQRSVTPVPAVPHTPTGPVPPPVTPPRSNPLHRLPPVNRLPDAGAPQSVRSHTRSVGTPLGGYGNLSDEKSSSADDGDAGSDTSPPAAAAGSSALLARPLLPSPVVPPRLSVLHPPDADTRRTSRSRSRASQRSNSGRRYSGAVPPSPHPASVDAPASAHRLSAEMAAAAAVRSPPTTPLSAFAPQFSEYGAEPPDAAVAAAARADPTLWVPGYQTDDEESSGSSQY